MKRLTSLALSLPLIVLLANCTTLKPNNIREVADNNVRGCKLLGAVNGSDAIFVGLSASVGSKNAKATALNQAVDLGATDVVWSQMGTSMTNEWVGKAYKCR